jgi:hypothetical protein
MKVQLLLYITLPPYFTCKKPIDFARNEIISYYSKKKQAFC